MRLPQYSEIDESAISNYYPPSEDAQLKHFALNEGWKYLMSTSTITSIMAHVYYEISNYKSPHFSNLSTEYDREPLKFMMTQRKPNSVILRQVDKENNTYAVNSDSVLESDAPNLVLLKMGKYMEKMMQVDADEFRK